MSQTYDPNIMTTPNRYVRDPIDRAVTASARSCSRVGGTMLQHSPSCSGIERYKGKSYVVLRNSYRVLAVYLIKPSGALKGVQEWPKKFGE